MGKGKTNEKPVCDIVMVYSKNLDLWAIDMTLNKPLEALIARYNKAETKNYQTLDKQTRVRYRFSSSLVGPIAGQGKVEQSVLEALFDKKDFGTGHRTVYTTDYPTGLKKIAYAKKLFDKLANVSSVIKRKVVAQIYIGDADA